jgi:hypothetical protein
MEKLIAQPLQLTSNALAAQPAQPAQPAEYPKILSSR